MRFLVIAKNEAQFKSSREKIAKTYDMPASSFTYLTREEQIHGRDNDQVVLCGAWCDREDIIELLRMVMLRGLTIVKESDIL